MAKKEMIKSFVLRVDAETMEAIEKWAADEFRSTNYKPQNKMFRFYKTFCSRITLINTNQNVILNPI